MIFLIDRFEGKENLYFSLESYRVHSRRVIQGEGIGSRQKYGGLWVKSDSDRCDYEFFWCVYHGFIRVRFFEKKKKRKKQKKKDCIPIVSLLYFLWLVDFIAIRNIRLVARIRSKNKIEDKYFQNSVQIYNVLARNR